MKLLSIGDNVKNVLLLALLASNIATLYLAHDAREAAYDAAGIAQTAADYAEESKSRATNIEQSVDDLDKRVRSIQAKISAF